MRPIFRTITASFLLSSLLAPNAIMAAVEESYTHEEPYAVTAWYGRAGPAEQAADLAFINGMKPHHAGALTMSEEYLNDPAAENSQLKQLARGIIHNQKFEIGMLETVEGHMKAAAQDDDSSLKQIATSKLAQKQRFVRAPMPGPLDAWGGTKNVSTRDVQFAKAMVIHHAAALDMARDYLSQEAAKNGYLERMCLDILVDQKQEINFMNSIVKKYPGDAEAIKPSSVHGMDHMGKHASGEKQKTAAKNPHHQH